MKAVRKIAPTAKRPRAPAKAASRRIAVGIRMSVPTRDRLLAAAKVEFAQHGFAGARVERMLAKAKANPRMLYHHFGGKAEIYVAVLESALGDLRQHELSMDVDGSDPLEGLLQLFDFMNEHFEANPMLVSLFSTENLLKAKYMRTSRKIREMSSPVLSMVATLLDRGVALGQIRSGLDPLRCYVLLVALCQFHLSNAHTLSVIFEQDLTAKPWREARTADARTMLLAFFQKSS